jgi:GTP-binding protein
MIDLATIKVKAGNGGHGAVSFRREKFVPKGGPDGGDGGDGGNVYALVDHNLATLMDFRSKSEYKAESGLAGLGKNKRGPDGDDLVIKVPLGTLIYEIIGDREILIEDMDEEKLLLTKGGRGGVGNYRFRSSTNQAPKQYTKGGKGEEKDIKLEVKIISDIGLIGAPNAGKSTLVNALTNAQAKVGSYPFTTISPNLGVLRLKSGQKAIVSDIPGLIEGASRGKGLGDEFLRHIERTRLLVHMIDPYEQGERDLSAVALRKYDMIQQELKEYKVDLPKKEQIVAINKMDITEVSEGFEDIKKAFKKLDVDVLGISAVSGEGLSELTNLITEKLSTIKKEPLMSKKKPVKLYNIDNLPNKRMVFGKSEVYELE